MTSPRFGPPDRPSRSPIDRISDSIFPPWPEESWVDREVDAMAAAWSSGHRLLASEVIARSPGIEDEDAVRLIYEEINLRRESGEDVHSSEVVRRYPRWKEELQLLLGCDRMLRPLSGPAELPEVGEQLGPFYLKGELGRGASGRTYLATEPTLADRPVVLKVISDDQEEHLSLARLQHTNIIPLFSEHSFPERRLRALCMPYLGGASLALVLEALASIPPGDRRGRDILHVLDRMKVARKDAEPEPGPYRLFIASNSYLRAICWIGTKLADALQEAHAHGLVHMDVKPSNVLIASDGSPMLLDFHLACRPIPPGDRFPGRVGGTPGWMAPEQRAALDAVAGGRPVPGLVDHRADIYALGMLLREALGGEPGASTTTSLRSGNPEVSVGLEDILRKCLADRPDERYSNAAALADDLRRHLDHEPLRGVPNRSPRERWSKWRERDRHALGRWLMGALSFILLLATFFYMRSGYEATEQDIGNDLAQARAFCDSRRYSDAVTSIQRGRERATRSFPPHDRLAKELAAQLDVANRGLLAESLHEIAERVRFRYGIEPPAGPVAEALVRKAGEIWEKRSLLLSHASALNDEAERQIREDLLEVVAAWVQVRSRPSPGIDLRRAQEGSLTILEQATKACGPSFTIDRLHRSMAERLGRAGPPAAKELAPRTASDRDELGRFLLHDSRFQAAAEQFRLGLDERPQDFWPHFYLGLCEYRLGHYQEAGRAFEICVALAPTDSVRAECCFNRGLALEALERPAPAEHEYDKALRWDSGLVAARLNRGILRFKAGRYSEAIDDLGRSLQSASDSKIVGRIHYNLSLVHLRQGDRAAARASAEKAIDTGDPAAGPLLERINTGR